jgi:hemoglobin/transferrin/lactoferrin receptor protein
MRIRLLTPFAIIALASMAVAQAARDAAEPVELPATIVSATRDERPLLELPSSAISLTADELRLDKAARTLPDALRNEASVMVQKTGYGQGSPYIRGFTGYRNLFLIDGIRLNNSVFRDGPNQYWNTVDTFSLSELEPVRGPFSVLYGSDAIGGTLNAITRGARDLPPGRDWLSGVYYRYSTAENSSIARAETLGRLRENLFLSLGYTFKDFGDLEGGKDVGMQEKTAYSEQDWDAKLEYFLDGESSLVLAHQGVQVNDAWRTHKTIYAVDWEGLSLGNELKRALDQDRKLSYLQLHKYGMSGVLEQVHAGVSYHQQSEERDRLRSEDRRDRQGFDLDTVGAFMSAKSASPLGELIYGFEYYRDSVDSFKRKIAPDGSVSSSAIQGPVGDDASYETFGLYLQDEIALGERLSLIAGGRYENARADAGRVEDPESGDVMRVAGDWDDILGSLRALYWLDRERRCNIYAGVSQGFRAPNLSDLTRLDTARTNEIETPTPDLDPEHFISGEIGAKADIERLVAQISYYYTLIDGMIVRTPTGRMIDGNHEVTKKNAGDGYVQGFELDLRYRLWGGLSALAVFSWMDGEVDTYPSSEARLEREYIDRLMPPSGTFGLRWERARRYWAEASCTVAADADKLSSRDAADSSRIPSGGTPGYTVFDLRAGWRAAAGLDLSLALENIGDEDYRIHGSGLNEAGRNLVLAAEWSF